MDAKRRVDEALRRRPIDVPDHTIGTDLPWTDMTGVRLRGFLENDDVDWNKKGRDTDVAPFFLCPREIAAERLHEFFPFPREVGVRELVLVLSSRRVVARVEKPARIGGEGDGPGK